MLQRLSNTDDPAACWEWMRARGASGHGLINRDSKSNVASRVAYTLFVGPIAKGLWVLHRCDNPPCCNPAHLFLGDQKLNMSDCASKGRGNKPKGEAHHRAKLTDDLVREIRARYAVGDVMQKDLSAEYGVTKPTIRMVVRNLGWKHVT